MQNGFVLKALTDSPNQSPIMDANWQVGNWQEDQGYDPARRYYNQYWSHTNSAYAAWEAKYQNSLGQSSYIEPSVDYEGSDMLSEPRIRVPKQSKPKANQQDAPPQPLPEDWRQQLIQLDQQSEKLMQKHQEHLRIVCANIPADALTVVDGPSGFSLLSKDSELELINTIVSKINILKKAELKGTGIPKPKDKDRSKLEPEVETMDTESLQESLEATTEQTRASQSHQRLSPSPNPPKTIPSPSPPGPLNPNDFQNFPHHPSQHGRFFPTLTHPLCDSTAPHNPLEHLPHNSSSHPAHDKHPGEQLTAHQAYEPTPHHHPQRVLTDNTLTGHTGADNYSRPHPTDAPPNTDLHTDTGPKHAEVGLDGDAAGPGFRARTGFEGFGPQLGFHQEESGQEYVATGVGVTLCLDDEEFE